MADQEDSNIQKMSAKTHSTRSSAYRSRSSRPISRASSVAEVVGELTVRALQEFDSGDMPQTYDTPADQIPEQDQQPAATSQPGSARGSRPTSGRPTSGRPRSGRPQTGDQLMEGTDKPRSSRPTSGRPMSGQIAGPGEGDEVEPAKSSRPTSGRPRSGVSGGSGKPSRQGSAASKRSVAERIAEDADQMDTGRAATDGGLDTQRERTEGEQAPTVPPPTQAPGTLAGELTDIADDADLRNYPVGEGDSDDGRDNQIAEEEDYAESDDDEEADLVVLDPDHPLMRRFQVALNKQLSRQHEKISLELSELTEALKRKMGERESIGVELYGIQQELARYQVLLEQNHDQYNELHLNREVKEQVLTGVRGHYKQIQITKNMEQKKAAELQQEVENLALRLFYVNNAKDDVRSDIAVMKRAAERADAEVAEAEASKRQQDLYVDRLVEQVDKLREDIALTEAQLTAQLEETKAAREALSEASMEIESINLEKKQLYAQWNSSLIGMKRRDEAHAAMTEANEQQRQRIKSLETEIEGFKKQIAKEEEHNEKLTLVLNKCEVDIATSKKLLDICSRKMEALKTEYSTYTRMLHETEEALNRATTEKIQRGQEINSLRKQIEKEYLEKVRLEDEIMEVIRNQLTFDKAAQYTDRMTKKTRQRTKDLDSQIAQVENEIAQDALNTVTTQARTLTLKSSLEQLEHVIKQKNDIITKSENEGVKRNAIIERKQQVIDQYNKRLEQMISQAGGVELGPLEITINSLTKSIESTQQEIAQLQLMWLREQGELVRLSKENDTRNDDVNMLKKKISILSQKKIRIENSIEKEEGEIVSIQKNIRNLRNDMIKLNQLLYSTANDQESLEKENVLTENDFIGKLKEAELDSIQMQAKLDSLKEEKERLLNSLVEAERQIMLWEKKTQLARETRAAVDSEVGQGEISAMKSEIHRMEVRYGQLMRQQEKMIQDMEKAVSRRDTIVTRGDAQAKIAARTKSKEKPVTKGTFQRQLAELKKKIKQTIQDASECDGELMALRDDQKTLARMLEAKQISCRELENRADTMDGDIERQVELKQRNMADLLTKQQRSKHLQMLKDKKYKRLVKDDNQLETEKEKQVDQMQTLSNIVQRLQDDYPHLQPALRKVSLSLGSRIMEESQTSARPSELMV